MSEGEERQPLADTLFGAGSPTETIRVIRVGEDAAFEPSGPVSFDPGEYFQSCQGVLPEGREASGLLALSAEVLPAEVEALAVTLWDDAGWIEPGVLHLLGDTRLCGPYRVEREQRQRLGLPSWVETAFILEGPRARSGPVPPELVTGHPLVCAYQDDMPAGEEWEALTGVYAMARRLAGCWRDHASGRVLQPDPDSAVDLAVYSPHWLSEDDLAEVVAASAPGCRIVAAPPPARGATRAGRRQAERRVREAYEEALGAEAMARVARESAAFDEMAAAHQGSSAAYTLTITAGRDSCVVIEATPLGDIPHGLRWEPWARGVLGCYRLTWWPAGGLVRGRPLTRVQRVERLQVAATIEAIASSLARLLTGAILDEDGFIVSAGE